ncbi:response regulator transcription factor [Adhaeribacter aquaticus]|uniref:response regulator transcription factor n=1 Tax=Adhaeribacter aquaticus TaxID=299567 RepID=UPI0004279E27|nr:response regulator transcription factor [Adhaeribacter aquaticus]
MIRVILVDDHRLIRKGLRSLLEEELTVQVVGEAESGSQLIDLLQTVETDVVIMDIKMPHMDGFDATRFLTKNFQSVKVLALSMFESENYINKMLEVGAQGYILKNITREELVHAVQMIANGKNYISAEITINLLKKNNSTASTENQNESTEFVELSKRELEVLKLITDGLTNAEIAEKLFTSKRTIDSHRQRIIEKTQAKNTAALVKYALSNGIIN